MRFLSAVLVVSWVLSGAAEADDVGKANELFERGRKQLGEAGEDPAKIAAACDTFNEAIQLDPEAPGTMLNLGLCNEKLGKFKTALYWFRKAQARASETGLPAYEQAAKTHTIDLAGKVATIKISFSAPPPPGAKVKIDGQEVKADEFLHAEVDSGHHTLIAGAPGKKIFTQEFDVEGRGGQTLTITLVEGDNSVLVDRGATRRKIAVVTAIGGGGLMLTSGVVSLIALRRYNRCVDSAGMLTPSGPTGGDSDCPGATPSAATKYANDQHYLARYWGTALFIGGGVAVGVAAAMYFTAPDKERVDQMVFAPVVAPDQVGFAVTGGF